MREITVEISGSILGYQVGSRKDGSQLFIAKVFDPAAAEVYSFFGLAPGEFPAGSKVVVRARVYVRGKGDLGLSVVEARKQ